MTFLNPSQLGLASSAGLGQSGLVQPAQSELLSSNTFHFFSCLCLQRCDFFTSYDHSSYNNGKNTTWHYDNVDGQWPLMWKKAAGLCFLFVCLWAPLPTFINSVPAIYCCYFLWPIQLNSSILIRLEPKREWSSSSMCFHQWQKNHTSQPMHFISNRH